GQMRTEISRLQRRLGITTVYVTHDQTEAMTLGDRVAVLRKGELQQVATPRELYERPVNLFVAGFIGSPPMNFVPATVEEDAVVLPFARVELPQEVCERISGHNLLIAGIRPDHFEDVALLDADEKGRGVTFKAHIDVTEWLGNELFAYIPFEAPAEVQDRLKSLARELDSESLRTQLVVSLDTASRIKDGEEGDLWFDSSRMHLFDPASGENLTRDLAYATT
ncbi:MAG TPA: ABC transporter ATP-binding protein, partial [Acidimicrobiales bacterium]|nr:ABC transporter ATP-binding protein [Acidimicrobiales bacterium]